MIFLSSSMTGRRRPRSWALLFLLGASVLRLSFATVSESDDRVDVNTREDASNINHGGSFHGSGSSIPDIEETQTGLQEQGSSVTTNPIEFMAPTYDLLSLIASPSKSNRIWIVIAMRKSCKKSLELLKKLTNEVLPKIKIDSIRSEDDSKEGDTSDNLVAGFPEINFVPLPLGDANDGLNEKILRRLGITGLPSLFFLWDEAGHVGDSKGFQLHLDNFLASAELYKGRSESVTDLMDGLNHYLKRLVLRSSLATQLKPPGEPVSLSETTRSNYDLPLTAIRVSEFQRIMDIVESEVDNRVSVFQHPPLPLDPDISEEDDRWIRYLMDDDHPSIPRSMRLESDNRRVSFGSAKDEKNSKQKGLHRDPTSARGFFRVVVQCRVKTLDKGANQSLQKPKQQMELYRQFNEAAKILGPRRDVLFSVIEGDSREAHSSRMGKNDFCAHDFNNEDGQIRLWDVQISGNELLNERYYSVEEKSTGLIDWLSINLRPDVLWFDRRMTAPIAFNPRYHRHAVLFVDLHDQSSSSSTLNVIRSFRRKCKDLQQEQQDPDSVILCMITPSTEVRVLNTFGIDIYSNLDRKATEDIQTALCQLRAADENGQDDDHHTEFCKLDPIDVRKGNENYPKSNFSSVLPTLMVTDRRRDGLGIERHYLDPPMNEVSLRSFLDDFIHGRTEPERKSGKSGNSVRSKEFSDRDVDHEIPMTNHSVYLPTSNSLGTFLDANLQKHVLVQLYAPTCGHCKRFNAVWNSLGNLVEFLGWSDKLVLARIDVTSNEIFIPGMVAKWLPDLFYFGVGVEDHPIQYDATSLANDVPLGAISDALELLEWWIDEAGEEISELHLLESLEG